MMEIIVEVEVTLEVLPEAGRYAEFMIEHLLWS